MKKFKTILSVSIAALSLASCMSIGAFAMEQENSAMVSAQESRVGGPITKQWGSMGGTVTWTYDWDWTSGTFYQPNFEHWVRVSADGGDQKYDEAGAGGTASTGRAGGTGSKHINWGRK